MQVVRPSVLTWQALGPAASASSQPAAKQGLDLFQEGDIEEWGTVAMLFGTIIVSGRLASRGTPYAIERKVQ